MQQKAGFDLVVGSQLSLLLIGVPLLLGGDIPWQLWSVQLWGRLPVLDVLLGVLAALLTYGVIYANFRWGSRWAYRLQQDLYKIRPHFAHYSWGQIALIALLAGVGEELLFRMVLQGWLSTVVVLPLAILVPALVFGLLHFLSFSYFVIACLMGLAFGWVYHLTQSAALVIVWHSVYDLIALGVIVKYPHLLGLTPSAQDHISP